jgi:hypothetical protein
VFGYLYIVGYRVPHMTQHSVPISDFVANAMRWSIASVYPDRVFIFYSIIYTMAIPENDVDVRTLRPLDRPLPAAHRRGGTRTAPSPRLRVTAPLAARARVARRRDPIGSSVRAFRGALLAWEGSPSLRELRPTRGQASTAAQLSPSSAPETSDRREAKAETKASRAAAGERSVHQAPAPRYLPR